MNKAKLVKRAIAAVKLAEAGYTLDNHECYQPVCYALKDSKGELIEFIQKRDGVYSA